VKIYDKASWHIDAGEPPALVLEKFGVVMSFLHENNLLTADGEEIFELGIEDSISLHEGMLTSQGKALLDSTYDSIINLPCNEIRVALDNQFSNR